MTIRRTDSGRGGIGGVGNAVMKTSRSEAASPGAKPHRARQGYAGAIGELGYECLKQEVNAIGTS